MKMGYKYGAEYLEECFSKLVNLMQNTYTSKILQDNDCIEAMSIALQLIEKQIELEKT
jgi:hypothetical protein